MMGHYEDFDFKWRLSCWRYMSLLARQATPQTIMSIMSNWLTRCLMPFHILNMTGECRICGGRIDGDVARGEAPA